MEPLPYESPRRCCERLFEARGTGDARLLEVPRGEERNRERPKEDIAAFGLRLNDILLHHQYCPWETCAQAAQTAQEGRVLAGRLPTAPPHRCDHLRRLVASRSMCD